MTFKKTYKKKYEIKATVSTIAKNGMLKKVSVTKRKAENKENQMEQKENSEMMYFHSIT